MAAPLLKGAARVRQQLTGLVFLAVIIGLVGLAIGLYQKAFTTTVGVTLKADRVGNQLTPGGDVKLRGLIVGQVRDVSSSGDGATLQLALKPDDAKLIPKNVQAQLLPKTLFGEKFVSLVIPDDASSQPISGGDVIPQDRSSTARETETALNDLLPLLQTLKPQEVSTTLNAVSTALRGRGNQIGQNLEIVDTYLKGLNPKIPKLGQNFRGVADFADTLEAARPNLIQVLDNLSFVNRSLVDSQNQLATFLTSSTTSTRELDRLVTDNGDRFIKIAADSLPPLQVGVRYSPEFACLAKGLDKQNGLAENTFGGLQPGLHITLEVVKSNGGYRAGDETAYGADNGPTCLGLPPSAPVVPFPVRDEYKDGYCDDQEKAPGAQTECTGRSSSPSPPAAGAPVPGAGAAPVTGLASDRAAVNAVAGPVMGLSPSEVPDLATLLFAPVARGLEIGLSAK